jgi:sulfiredoxin
MLKRENFAIETIYVPVKRRGTLDPKRVEEIAQSMLVDGQTTPNPGAAGRRAFRAGRGSTSTRGCKGIGRADDRRLPGQRAEALKRRAEQWPDRDSERVGARSSRLDHQSRGPI